MIEGEEKSPAQWTGRDGTGEERSEEEQRRRWMDGQTDKTETTAARQRTHIPSKTGCEGEQVCIRGAEKRPDKGRREENGGGGLWLSGLALGWS